MLFVCMFETMESKCVLSVFVCCSTLSHYKLDVKVDRSGYRTRSWRMWKLLSTGDHSIIPVKVSVVKGIRQRWACRRASSSARQGRPSYTSL